MLKAWTREHILCETLQAEAAPILWALKFANYENFRRIIVEGDVKVWFNTLNGDHCNVNCNQ